MKKVLALALVLVLALGMMVPATAASKGKITGFWTGMPDTDLTFVGDIHPGTDIALEFDLDEFVWNTEAGAALATAWATGKESTIKAAYKRLIETIEPRFAVRKGGQIFDDISIDNVKGGITSIDTARLIRVVKEAALGAIDDRIAAGLNYTVYKTEIDATRAAINRMTWSMLDLSSATDAADVKAAMNVLFDNTFDRNDILRALFDSNINGAIIAIQGDVAAAFDVAYDEEIDDAGMNFWTFEVVLETLDPWASVKDVDFEVDVYFLIDGKRTDNLYIHTVEGNFSNRVTDVDADTYDADSYEGQVIDALEYVPSIAIVGNYEYDISANVKMAKDKLIYFYVTTEADMADEGIFDRYPSIELAFKVLEVGLSSSYNGNFIKLGGVDSSYYVYGKGADGGLKYLGRGGEMLPFSAKYYISTQKLDLSDDEPVDEIPVDVPSIVDDYNPSTGI